MVAEAHGRFVGAAWDRFWNKASHSCGYIDDATIEIGLVVELGYRRRGIGRRLMTRLLALAAEGGVTSLSLSVERDNPAVDLYESLGFRHHDDVDNAWNMFREVNP